MSACNREGLEHWDTLLISSVSLIFEVLDGVDGFFKEIDNGTEACIISVFMLEAGRSVVCRKQP